MPGPIEAQLVAEAAERRKAFYPPARVVNIADRTPEVELLRERVDKLRKRVAELEDHCTELQRRLCEWNGTPIAVEVIIRAVCEHFSVTMAEIAGDKRTKRIIGPRHVAIWLIRDMTELSLLQIGRRFGLRDHTSIQYGADRIAGIVATDPDNSLAGHAIALRKQVSDYLGTQRKSV